SLADIGYIQLGNGDDGKSYGRVVAFSEHQRINRQTPSKIKVLQISWEPSLNTHRRLTEPSHPEQGTGNREQGKEHSVSDETVVVSNGNDPTPDLPDFPESLRREPGGKVDTRQPVQKAFDNWNTAAMEFGLPRAGKLTEDRRRKLRQRLKEHGIEGWDRALANIENTPFLRGDNDRGWQADLDFLLQPKSLNKVIEGGYGINRRPDGSGGRASKAERAKAAVKRAAVAGGYAGAEPGGETGTGDDAVSVLPKPEIVRKGAGGA
ncbi:hypothetical protein LCGC14_2149250, partial [marine sediment metagenome]